MLAASGSDAAPPDAKVSKEGIDWKVDVSTTVRSVEGLAKAVGAMESVLPSAKTTLRTVLGSRKASVPSVETKVVEYCRKMGYAFVECDERAVDHPLSHTCRELATLYAAQQQISNLTRARVASVYGVARDKTLLEVKDRGHGTVLTCTVDLVPNKFFPGDCTRSITRVDPTGEYDLVYAVDVYWDGDHPVSPATYAKWCKLSRTNDLYVITRMFRGAAGSDSVPEYTGPEEGVWYRDAKDEMIVFSPDKGNFTYPRHYSIDFLEHKTIDKLDIRHQATIGPYFIFKVHLSSSVTTVPAAVHLTPGDPQIDWMVLQAPTLWGKIGCFQFDFDENNMWYYNWFVRERRFLHNTLIMNSHWLQNVVRQPTGYVFDGVAAKVQEAAKDDRTMVALKERFPKVYVSIVKGTAMAILYKHRRAMANDMHAVREDHSDTEVALVNARSVAPLQQTRNFCQKFIVIVVLVWIISLMFASQYRGTPMRHDKRSLATDSHSDKNSLFGMLEIYATIMGIIGCWCFYSVYCCITNHRANLRAVYERWRDARETEPGSERFGNESGWVRLTEADTLMPVEVEAMPTHVPRGTLKITVDGKTMTPKQAFEVLRGTRPGRNLLYPLIRTSGDLYAPAKTESNLIFAAYARIHAEVVSSVDDVTLVRNWQLAEIIYSQIIPEGVLKPYTIEECASAWQKAKAALFLQKAADMQEGRHREVKMPSKYDVERYVSLWNDMRVRESPDGKPSVKPWNVPIHIWYRSRKELNVKTNETIACKPPYAIKPRSIVVMDVFDHVGNAPWSRAVADAMHELFSGQWYSYTACGKTVNVRIWFGSGLTGAQLSEIGQAIAHGDNVIAVAGDDIIMRHGSMIIEGDLSACDQSHTFPCIVACSHTDERMGVPEEVTTQFINSCCEPYVAAFQRVVINGDPGPQLPTGSSWTTVRNTKAVMGLCLVVAARIMPTSRERDIQSMADDMGFKLKVQIHEHVEYSTFLKGTFLPDKKGRISWFYLPSMVLKIGKLQTDPASLGGTAKASRAMAQGMVGVPRDYPILGAAVAALYRNGQHTSSILNAAEDGWYKPTITSEGVDRATALEIICRRYDISVQDINRVENIYDSVRAVPAFVIDPVFNKLAARDYE
jgi:hypothetical protein